MFFLMLFSCQTTQESKAQNVNYILRIEKVSLGSRKINIIKEFGETKDMGQNKEKGTYALGYSDGKVPRRYSFFFNQQDDLVFSKSIYIYENEPESSLDFWNTKYPNGNFKIENRTTDHGHYWSTDSWIAVDKNLTLTIEKKMVSQANWAF